MAVLSRPTFADMETEVVRRLGGIDYTGFSTRVEHWIANAYSWAATSFHHIELDAVTSSPPTVSVGDPSYDLPSDCYIVLAVRLGTNYNRWLRPTNFEAITAKVLTTNGAPVEWSRFLDKVYFDRPPALETTAVTYYIKEPAAPDFSTPTSSALAAEWDELIVLKATILGLIGTWRPDLASGLEEGQLLPLLQSVPNLPLATGAHLDKTVRTKVEEGIHGAQG